MSKGNALWLLGLNVSHMAFSCKKPFLAMFKDKKKSSQLGLSTNACSVIVRLESMAGRP